MFKLDLDIAKLKALEKSVSSLAGTIRHEMESAVHSEAEHIGNIATSSPNFPVKTGALRDSRRISDPEWQNNAVSSNITFGSDDVVYAAAVHERDHAKNKYLERPLRDESASSLKRMGEQMKRVGGNLQ